MKNYYWKLHEIIYISDYNACILVQFLRYSWSLQCVFQNHYSLTDIAFLSKEHLKLQNLNFSSLIRCYLSLKLRINIIDSPRKKGQTKWAAMYVVTEFAVKQFVIIVYIIPNKTVTLLLGNGVVLWYVFLAHISTVHLTIQE